MSVRGVGEGVLTHRRPRQAGTGGGGRRVLLSAGLGIKMASVCSREKLKILEYRPGLFLCYLCWRGNENCLVDKLYKNFNLNYSNFSQMYGPLNNEVCLHEYIE